MVWCASPPGQFAVVGDLDGAPVGPFRVGDGEDGAGVGTGLGDGGGESVAEQGETDDLDEG